MTMNRNYQKSTLNAFTTASQTLLADNNVAFANNGVLTGCSISHAAGTPTIVLGKPGLYYVSFEADALPSAAGTITVALQNNSVTIPGAITSVTGTAATTTRIILDAIVEVKPSCCAVDNTKNLTFNNDGVETVYTNATVSVIKLC